MTDNQKHQEIIQSAVLDFVQFSISQAQSTLNTLSAQESDTELMKLAFVADEHIARARESLRNLNYVLSLKIKHDEHAVELGIGS